MRSSVLLLTVFGLSACFSDTRTFASSEPYWQWRNPLPQGNDYDAIAYGAGRFVAVGRAGTITTSTDGITWVAANSGVAGNLQSIAYGNGRFVARSGYNGFTGVLTSDDGVTWNPSTAGVPDGWNNVRTVTYAGDRFFAMTNESYTASLGRNFVASSIDGVNWTESASASAANVGRIAFGNGSYVGQDLLTGTVQYVDSSHFSVTPAKMLRSADGVTWVPGGEPGLASIDAGPTYFNGRWVVGGRLLTQASDGTQRLSRALSTSTDGGATWAVVWQDSAAWGGNMPLTDLPVFGGRMFLLGDANLPIVSTADLVTARTDMSAQRLIQLNAAAVSADRIVAVGRFGLIVSSADGVNWTSPTSNSLRGNLRAAAFGDGQWIVAGDEGLAASSDGITWRMLAGTDSFNAGSVAYGNGRFVAAAQFGPIGVSTDHGATWTLSSTRAPHRNIVFAQGRFVGSVGLTSSTDGLAWTAEVPPPGGTGRWTGVFTVNDVFYAVGTPDPDQRENGVIARSVDGLTWTVVATMPETVITVGGKEGLLVACGFLGEVWTSTDGVTWTKQAGRPLLPFGSTASIQWVGDSLVAATYYGQIVMSADGVAWTKDEFASSGMMFGLASGNGQVLAVGNGGVVWEVGAARFTRQPEGQTVATGSSVTFTAAAVGKEPLSYQWQKDGAAVVSARSRSLTIASAQMADAGNYTVVVSNSLGATTSAPAALVVGAAPTPPTITSQPESKSVIVGASVTFSVGATGFAPLTYQWRKDNAAIPGATGASYTIGAAALSDAGTYTVAVMNPVGTAASNGATLTVAPPPSARLVNIAARAYATTEDGVTIGGFVIAGSVPKQVLLRAVGPSLTAQGLQASEVLADPLIELHHGAETIATNDNWGDNSNSAAITAAAVRVGARPLEAGDTKSAAMLTTLNPGIYTFVTKGTNNTSGIVLLEVYDVDGGASSFVNIASRAYCTTGNGVTIGGFVITGNIAKQVLMRAVGPTMATQGLGQSEVLADPTMELHHGLETIATNDNWGDNANAAAIVSAGARIGATPFAAGDTKSSALLMTLQPGAYTFVARGKNDTSGLVLVEVYDATEN